MNFLGTKTISNETIINRKVLDLDKQYKFNVDLFSSKPILIGLRIYIKYLGLW